MEKTHYALVEDEQRFAVPAVPVEASGERLVEDRYVRGSRLRLRLVHADDGVERKLGQKVPISGRPSAVWHTTIYLDESEWRLLEHLEADTLRKRRHDVAGGCVDEFLDELAGLVLVEGERPLAAPVSGVEVTDDPRFRGGALAAATPAEAEALVAEVAGWFR